MRQVLLTEATAYLGECAAVFRERIIIWALDGVQIRIIT